MAERTFSFRVISPLGTAFQGDARSVTLPTPDGEITILANHMPLVVMLADGELRIDTGEKVVSVAVAGGFLETGAVATAPERRWEATVLSDFAAESDSIEVARVEAAKARAEELLQEKKERADLILIERDLQRAILQLKVAEKARSRRRGSTAP
jgi:F-type H+-transporting ATPase subunit epsilon